MSSVSTEDSGCQFGRLPVPIPGHKLGQLVDRMALSHAIDDICQVGLWIEAVKLGSFEHGVQDGRSLAASEPRKRKFFLVRAIPVSPT